MYKKLLVLSFTVLFVCFAAVADAKLKGLPTIKSYKDYTLNKNNVASVKYTVHVPVVNGDEITPGDIADFTAEIFFDDKGNRVKEVIYHIETGKVEMTYEWTYNEQTGSVTLARTDAKGDITAREDYIVSPKQGTVTVRRYENVTLADGSVKPNVLIYDELWTEAKKEAVYRKTFYSVTDGIASRQSIKKYPIDKPYTLYRIMDETTAPVDYTWLPDYSARLFKASNGKTRNEAIYNGSTNKYEAKKKVLHAVSTVDADRKLRNITTYNYRYDRNKNWTQLVQYENSLPAYVVVRDIKYK
jgi:hypothetical protein